MEDLVIRNRKITAEDLPVIQAVVNEHWDRGRTHISRELCKHWNWFQPSGRLKDMACRELLLTLHRKNLIDYPPSQNTPKNVGRTTARSHVDQTLINCTLVWQRFPIIDSKKGLLKSCPMVILRVDLPG